MRRIMRRYTARVAKTSVDIDQDIAREVAEILGTKTLRDTVDAALHEIVNIRKRKELIKLLAEPGRFDFTGID